MYPVRSRHRQMPAKTWVCPLPRLSKAVRVNDKKALRVLRRAERGMLALYRYFPYASDLPEDMEPQYRREHALSEQTAMDCLAEVRKALKEVETDLLNVLEHSA
jgi:hypothetical protein